MKRFWMFGAIPLAVCLFCLGQTARAQPVVAAQSSKSAPADKGDRPNYLLGLAGLGAVLFINGRRRH